jgi:succinyl-CoA synthetase beta subunit
MKIHEYQAKTFLQKYGIPVPEGKVATTAHEAQRIAQEIGCPVMIKAQVLVGGRGKAGGVKMAKDPKEAAARARAILGMKIKGIEVQRVLVARAVDTSKGVLRRARENLDRVQAHLLGAVLNGVRSRAGRYNSGLRRIRDL